MTGRSESRIITRLIDRSELLGHRSPVRIIDNGVQALFRVGPYDVLRGVVRAPGAWLVEARGPNGEAVLLQLAHLADAIDPREEARVAKATAALFVDSEIPILAHGGADREDGSRILFWAMPWRTDVDRLTAPGMYVEDTTHLLRIAVALCTRLATRHILGGFEPLLSEHTVIVLADGAEIVGVPISIAPHHLATEMPCARLAPEEIPAAAPTKLGDLWRLGHTLIALAPGFDRLPDNFRALLQRLGSADPSRRPARATEVLAELEAIHAELAPYDPPLTSKTAASTVPQMTRLDAAGPVPMVLPPGGTIQTPSASQDLPEVDDEPTLDAGPPWAFFFSSDEFAAFLAAVAKDLERRELKHTFGTGVVQIGGAGGPSFRYMGLTDLARTCHRRPRSEWAQLIRADFDQLLEATAKDPDVGTPVDFDVEPAPIAPRRDRRNDSLDSVLVEPVPIVVGNRMSEQEAPTRPAGEWVVAPSHPTHFDVTTEPNDIGDTETLDEERTEPPQLQPEPTTPDNHPTVSPEREPDTLPTDAWPTVPPRVGRPAVGASPTLALPTVEDAPERSPPLIDGSHSPTLGPELRAIATNQGPKRAVLAVFLILSSVGAVVWAWQNQDTLRGLLDADVRPQAHVATHENAVRVDADPQGAIVVGERDGRVLGRAPLRVLVPTGVEAAVLVTAPGHEPQRLVLPDRGVIRARLDRLPKDVKPCGLDLAADAKAHYEGVAADLAYGDRLAVHGAAVVRLRGATERRGAWLVRCPSFGGGDHVALDGALPPKATITLAGPPGSIGFLEDEPLGPLPVTVPVEAAFSRVAVELDERRYTTWIPTAEDARFTLPEPHERPQRKKRRRRE